MDYKKNKQIVSQQTSMGFGHTSSTVTFVYVLFVSLSFMIASSLNQALEQILQENGISRQGSKYGFAWVPPPQEKGKIKLISLMLTRREICIESAITILLNIKENVDCNHVI